MNMMHVQRQHGILHVPNRLFIILYYKPAPSGSAGHAQIEFLYVPLSLLRRKAVFIWMVSEILINIIVH